MDDLKRRAIARYIDSFAKSMEAVQVMDHLQFDLLKPEDVAEVNAEATRHKRARKLIEILYGKREDSEPFEKFEAALQKTEGHKAFAREIRQALNELHDSPPADPPLTQH
uniref:CARD domain-containing protein n=1 Tax=Plectus sambesii TaxID=2011161 RepID=A0A914WCL2_9BILA